ncbi:gamma subclass chorismate mutase AroQ [Glaciimonas soli]|uniref:chorismate mutase n=1 Tax=Glaciimonas soli TaxID=2590999 RepID=A0A843YPB6_9BURK|nr:gamma subclass chorismate mutase AroQ [Glaciimonas soli]MQQ99613.1 gamma subclass chorismate mutase AroQ [Glaciimonas soli]
MSIIKNKPFYYSHYFKFSYFFALMLLLSACQHIQQSQSLSEGQISASESQKIDHLLMLINQRLEVAVVVAKAKWHSGAAIDDPLREASILNAVAAQARATSDLDSVFVRGFFQDQFDAGKIIQQHLISGWRQNPPSTPFDVPDLARDVRPVLDQLNPQLITALQDSRPLLKNPRVQAILAEHAQIFIHADAEIRQQVIQKALQTLLSNPA